MPDAASLMEQWNHLVMAQLRHYLDMISFKEGMSSSRIKNTLLINDHYMVLCPQYVEYIGLGTKGSE